MRVEQYPIWRNTMTEQARFHILTPEGVVPLDTFVLADEQPVNVLDGCLLVVHEPSGRLLTVHRTRLIPVNEPDIKFMHFKHSACPKCGHVEGIMLDKVHCPNHHGVNCGLLEIKTREDYTQEVKQK
jgi:hypothetical protein